MARKKKFSIDWEIIELSEEEIKNITDLIIDMYCDAIIKKIENTGQNGD